MGVGTGSEWGKGEVESIVGERAREVSLEKGGEWAE